ncbi:MAG: zinc-dependent metalloprotease [Myxococcota bacterium]
MKTLSLFAATAALAFSAACAAPVQDIDRTQPDYYPKGYFTGEWYVRPTVIRTQYNQGMLFEGYEGNMEKVRWEIQEDQLIAWRSYEFIPNAEANPGSHTPIAIFRIAKHFDVKRDYNPSTGVETNVIVENDFDRPWWERDFVRVDWSQNLADDLDLGGYIKFFMADGQIAINQSGNGDRYEVERPRITAEYIDVVVRHRLFVDWGSIWDYSMAEQSEADVRWSFRKVDPNNDYEPLVYPDFINVKTRYRYARQVGVDLVPCTPSPNDAGCQLYDGPPSAGARDPAPLGDGTALPSCLSASDTATPGWDNTVLCHPDTRPEDDCFCAPEKLDLFVDGNGNICDSRLRDTLDPEDCNQITYPVFERFGFFRTLRMPFDWERDFAFNSRIYLANRWNIWERSRVTENGVTRSIPYAERKPKPIIYYTNPEFPEDLMPAAQKIADDWDVAFRATVAGLQGVEPNAVPRMYELRRNSCSIEGVKQFARDKGLEWVLDKAVGGVERVEMGNLKRACTALEVETLNESDDRKFTWQRVGDLRYAFMHWVHTPQQAGPLGYGPSSADPETGEIISANAYIYGAAVDTYANFAADMVQLLNGEIPPSQFTDGENVVTEITAGRAKVNEGLSKRSTRQLMDRFDAYDAANATGAIPQLPAAQDVNMADPRSALALSDQNARLKSLEDFAAQHLVDDDMLRAFAGPDRYQPGQIPSEEALRMANPANWGRYPDPLKRMLGQTTADFRAEADAMGVADRYSKVERMLAERNIEYGSMLAEPAVYGLALSLKGKTRDEVVRHARQEIFRGVEAHEVGHTLGLRHNFAGSADPLNFIKDFWTQPELSANPASRKWDYAYSSIMDYHQRFSSDWAGIGPYDRAAIKFGYGQLVETFDETEGEFVPRDYFDFATSVMDYKDLPRILGGADVDNQFEQAYYRALGGQDPMLQMPASVTPNIDNMYKRKDVRFSEVFDEYLKDIYGAYVDDTNSPTGRRYIADYVPEHYMVPFQYCSDMYAWGGNLTCNRYDMGGNMQEIVENARQMYEGYYIFNNFRRDRYTFAIPGSFSVGGYLGRLYDRTFQPMLNSFRYFYFYRRSLLTMYPLVVDWATAAFNGLNFFGGVLQKPEPGNYCLKLGTFSRTGGLPCDANSPTISIPLGEGRYFGTRWTDEYYYKLNRIGSYWDKWLATQALTDSQFFLVRNFSSLFDRGAFSITYYRVFEKEMTELFRSIMAGDLSQFSAYVQQDPETGMYQVITRPIVGAEGSQAPALPTIKPPMNWPLQKSAALYAFVGLTSTVDRRLDFARRMRVTYQGAADDPLYEGFTADQLVTFTDPLTHLTYRAAQVGGPDAPGYQMVRDARDFHSGSWTPARTALDQAVVAYETAVASGDQTAIAVAEEALAETEANFSSIDRALRDKVDVLEYLRILGFYTHLYTD